MGGRKGNGKGQRWMDGGLEEEKGGVWVGKWAMEISRRKDSGTRERGDE